MLVPWTVELSNFKIRNGEIHVDILDFLWSESYISAANFYSVLIVFTLEQK